MTKNMQIIMIRHGLTDANERRAYYGATDLSLTENGVRELLQKREKYEKLITDKAFYFTTDMKRTKETFRVLFEKDGRCPEYNVVTGLQEINFGDFELKTYDELKDTQAFLDWISGDNEKNVPPNGESGAQMADRISKSFDEFVKSIEKNITMENPQIVLVCHGGTIYYVLKHLFPDEVKSLYEWQPENGDGYILERKYDKWSYKEI